MDGTIHFISATPGLSAHATFFLGKINFLCMQFEIIKRNGRWIFSDVLYLYIVANG